MSGRTRVSIRRDKLDELRKRNDELKSIAIKFGVTGPDGAPTPPHPGSDGLNVAEVAQIHEFGLGVPERSIVRAVANGNRHELGEALAAGAVAALDIRARAQAIEPIIGDRAVELLLERHHNLGSVITKEGISRPALDDTGAIRENLRWAKDDDR